MRILSARYADDRRDRVIAVLADGQEMEAPCTRQSPLYSLIADGAPEVRGPDGNVIVAAQPPIIIAEPE